MEVTIAAAHIILGIMIRTGLDPSKFSILVDQHKHGCSLEFTNERRGREYNFYGLKVQLAKDLDFRDVVVDYTESNGKSGKSGIIFRNSQSMG